MNSYPPRMMKIKNFTLLVLVIAWLWFPGIITADTDDATLFPVSAKDSAAGADRKPQRIWGYISGSGEVVVAPRYRSAFEFVGQRARVEVSTKRWAYIDKNGRELFRIDAISVGDFYDECARVTTGSGMDDWCAGFIGPNGNHVILPKFLGARDFSEGLAAVAFKADRLGDTVGNQKWGFIDKTGTVVLHGPYDAARDFSQGLAAVKAQNLWGYITRHGRTAIAPRFERAEEFRHERAKVRLSRKWGFIDRKGSLVIKTKYDWAKEFSEGLAVVSIGGRSGFISVDGSTAIDLRYQSCLSFSGGLAAVKVDNRWGYIDKVGKLVIPAIYDWAFDFRQGLAYVERDGNNCYIDKNHKVIWVDVAE